MGRSCNWLGMMVMALANAFGTDVNGLPLSLVLVEKFGIKPSGKAGEDLHAMLNKNAA
ncbi:MAG: hypothetical protein U1F71_04530 [Verrucomicrobiaceae bacterium]